VALTDDLKITTFAPTAAGTSTITQTTGLDMAGFSGVVYVVRLGTPNATNTLKAQQCDTVGGTYADLTATAVGSGTDGPLILDVARASKQFVKYVITRSGASTTIDTLVAIQYGARNRPVTQEARTQVEKYVGPVEGTA
jgi:hypothetical protein